MSPTTMSQAQFDTQAIGGYLDTPAPASGSSMATWLIGGLILAGVAWYFWPQISAWFE